MIMPVIVGINLPFYRELTPGIEGTGGHNHKDCDEQDTCKSSRFGRKYHRNLSELISADKVEGGYQDSMRNHLLKPKTIFDLRQC